MCKCSLKVIHKIRVREARLRQYCRKRTYS
uniref:Uncharacterized protein n=1 Tax=Rhizophora mucronata TaxID=61149 RepID=A0A2P2IT78_RHIMU